MRSAKGYRLFICVLLTISLCSFCSGLRSVAAVNAAEEARRSESYYTRGYGREAFPTIFVRNLLDGKYKTFYEAAKREFPVPGLAQGYVPQGMAYAKEIDCFFVTSYCAGGGQASQLAVIDGETGTRRKTLRLQLTSGVAYQGHAGGVAVWGDNGWIVSEGRAYHFSVKDVQTANDGGTLRFRDDFSVGQRADYAFCAQDVLWIGEYYVDAPQFAALPSHMDAATGNAAWIRGYKLSKKNTRGVTGLHLGEDPTPSYLLSAPDCVQGMCLTNDGSIVLSASRTAQGASNALVFPPLKTLLKMPAQEKKEINGNYVPLWALDAKTAQNIALPPMSEGIALRGERVYFLFESAASLYRGRTELYLDCVFSLANEQFLITM
ncbi:MAG: hypothetical protein LBB67_08245 [Oscillospiraceae bacterium]|nr:hypothetical protein [Oscillospiraceae bacterium]